MTTEEEEEENDTRRRRKRPDKKRTKPTKNITYLEPSKETERTL